MAPSGGHAADTAAGTVVAIFAADPDVVSVTLNGYEVRYGTTVWSLTVVLTGARELAVTVAEQ